MFRPLCGGPADIPGGTRLRATATGVAAVAVAALLGRLRRGIVLGRERAGRHLRRARSTEASFPTEQHLGQTSLMQLGVRNTGEKTVPALTVTISIAGEEGQTSSLPFGIRDPQPGLAQPDRPVWVLAAGYPRLAGSSEPGRRHDLEPQDLRLRPAEARRDRPKRSGS